MTLVKQYIRGTDRAHEAVEILPGRPRQVPPKGEFAAATRYDRSHRRSDILTGLLHHLVAAVVGERLQLPRRGWELPSR